MAENEKPTEDDEKTAETPEPEVVPHSAGEGEDLPWCIGNAD
jgi:hypothetical protein